MDVQAGRSCRAITSYLGAPGSRGTHEQGCYDGVLIGNKLDDQELSK